MKKVLTFSGLLLTLCINAHTQVLTGGVRDSTGVPLPDAVVTLIRLPAQIVLSYTTTDRSGNFSLNSPAPGHDTAGIRIRVRLFGYREQTLPFQAGKTSYDFMLHPEPAELPEAVVSPGRPHAVSNGDTTAYRVADFARRTDQSIGEVIRRMPGLEVDNTGKIFFNGKAVTAFYIDGDNLLDDKYNIGTTAIPAGIVDKVQVIENHEPIKVKAGQTEGGETALNISLNNKSRQRPINQVAVAGGLPNYFDFALTNLIFNSQFKSLNQYKANDVGIDYKDDLTDYNNQTTEDRTGFQLPKPLVSLAPVGYPPIDPRRYLFNNGGILNTNNLFHLFHDLQVKLKASWWYDRQNQQYDNSTSSLLANQTITYTDQVANTVRPQRLNTEISININRRSLYFENKLRLQIDQDRETGSVTNNQVNSGQTLSGRLTSLTNELRILRMLTKGVTLEAYSFTAVYHYPQMLSLQPAIFPAGYGLPDSLAQLTQQVSLPAFYSHEYFSITLPRRLAPTFRLGANWLQQQLNSTINGQPPGNQTQLAADSGRNDLHWRRYKVYSEVQLNYSNNQKSSMFSLRLPFSVIDTRLENRPTGPDSNFTNWYLEPTLTFRHDPASESAIHFLYSLSNDPGTLFNFYPGYILDDHRTMLRNGGQYEVNRQVFDIGYTYRKTPRLLFFNIDAKYTRLRSTTIANSTVTDSLTFISTSISPQPNTGSFQLLSGVSKYLFPLNSTVSMNYQFRYTRTNIIENGLFLPFDNHSQQLALHINTRIRQRFELNYIAIASRFSGKVAAGQSATPTATVNTLSQKMQMIFQPIPLLDFKASLEDLFNPMTSARNTNTLFADATVRYRVARIHADMEVTAANLGNSTTYRLTVLTVNSLSTTSYPLRPRIILFKLLFNL